MAVTVSDCISYSLKSGAGMREEEAHIMTTGIAGDRQFMLVDADNHFLNQKQLPALATHSLSSIAQVTPIRITNDLITVTLYGENLHALRAHDETNAILSHIFKQAVKLVMFPLNEKRNLESQFSQPGDTTCFADEFPILIASQSSLDALASHFKSAVAMDRFRPNIVLEGLPPFAEDTLKRIKIGNQVELEIVKNCARCAITTIDQNTGERIGAEPLATLNKLRKGENSVYFGAYAIPRKTGTIKIGDTVEILEKRPICPDMAKTKINGMQF